MTLKTVLTATLATALSFGVTDSAKSGGYTCRDYVNAPTFNDAFKLFEQAEEKITQSDSYLREASQKIKPRILTTSDFPRPRSKQEENRNIDEIINSYERVVIYQKEKESLHMKAIGELRTAIDTIIRGYKVNDEAWKKHDKKTFIEGFYVGFRTVAKDEDAELVKYMENKFNGITGAMNEIERRISVRCREKGHEDLNFAFREVMERIKFESGIQKKIPGEFSDDVMKLFESSESDSGKEEKK